MKGVPLASESWLESHVLRPWVPGALIVMPLAALRFLSHACIQWAAALAYYTLIGFVPLFTAVFALIKLFGLHRGLTPFVVSTVGAGSPAVAREIIAFIDATNLKAVGVLAALGALLAVIGIMSNAELCFNQIWGVRGRTWRRKFRSFFLLCIAAPLLLLLALALTAILQPGHPLYEFLDTWRLGVAVLVVLRLVPYALLWLSFTLLYTLLPNTEVRTRSAVFGAVVAGTLWQLAQFAYVVFFIRLVRYSAVYGALWQLPILLAWIYVAWGIILFGAEVTRAHQEVSAQRLALRAPARTADPLTVE
ncbi:MAG: YihY/virulence factor BrkB family protein [Deltaproteobacteria bacterium]|nr:YihY/virulence factor BrkB family protein [Deltaproteobacteria bacterium]